MHHSFVFALTQLFNNDCWHKLGQRAGLHPVHPELEASGTTCSPATMFRCCLLLDAAKCYSNTIPEPHIQQAPPDVILFKGGAATAAIEQKQSIQVTCLHYAGLHVQPPCPWIDPFTVQVTPEGCKTHGGAIGGVIACILVVGLQAFNCRVNGSNQKLGVRCTCCSWTLDRIMLSVVVSTCLQICLVIGDTPVLSRQSPLQHSLVAVGCKAATATAAIQTITYFVRQACSHPARR